MKTADNLKQLGSKVPDALLRKLDQAANKARRTRSSEVRIRLERSLRDHPVLEALR